MVGIVIFFYFFFFFKQKTAYEIMPSLVGSEMCIRDRLNTPNRKRLVRAIVGIFSGERKFPWWEHLREYTEEDLLHLLGASLFTKYKICLLYTSDAADDLLCVDLGGRRIIKT